MLAAGNLQATVHLDGLFSKGIGSFGSSVSQRRRLGLNLAFLYQSAFQPVYLSLVQICTPLFPQTRRNSAGTDRDVSRELRTCRGVELLGQASAVVGKLGRQVLLPFEFLH